MLAASDLLEREGELAQLGALIEAARDGAGRFVLLEGGAGIGKTGLLTAAREWGREAGMDVLHARGGELEREFSYGIVRQLFEPALAGARGRSRAEILSGAAALAAPLFGGDYLADGGSTAAESGFATVHGLFWLTANLAGRRPLMLAVDDLHWADKPSLRWLSYLIRRLEGLPLLVVACLRPAEPEGEDRALAERLLGQLQAIAPGAELPKLPGEPRTAPHLRAPRRRRHGARDAAPRIRSTLSQRQTRLIVAVASCAVIVVVAVLAVAGVFSGGGSSGSPTTAGTGGSATSAGGGSSQGGNGGSLGSLAPIKLNGAGGKRMPSDSPRRKSSPG